MLERLRTYDALLLDLDGTIADLVIDWEQVRARVGTLVPCASTDASLTTMVEQVSASRGAEGRRAVAEILAGLERPSGRVSFTAREETVKLLKEVERFWIVTNNLHATARDVLCELKLADRCAAIVGFDDVSQSKPDPEAYLQLVTRQGPFRHPVYIGDRDSDVRFAANAGIDFIHVDALCE